VFQDKDGFVYTIDDEVRQQMGDVVVRGHDVLALVDADGAKCQPDSIILNAVNLRILLTSSPRLKGDWRWLIQDVHNQHPSYVVGPWRWGEFAVASFVTSV
jgi:hypothetical protein